MSWLNKNNKNDKITDDGGVGYSSPRQLDMFNKATREYERGLLSHMDQTDNETSQSFVREIKTRSDNDRITGR